MCICDTYPRLKNYNINNKLTKASKLLWLSFHDKKGKNK